MTTSIVMDSSLAAFLFAFVYGPNTWMLYRMWSGLDERLDLALEKGRKALQPHKVPLSKIFVADSVISSSDRRLRNRLRNYFSGEATVVLTRPLHLILSLPLILWGVVAISKADLWSKGQISISDFGTIFGSACLWLVVSAGIFCLQFLGFRKLSSAVPSDGAD
jgi:hypothetical protein